MKKTNRDALRFLNETAGGKKGNITLLLLLQMIMGVSGVGLAWLLRGGIDCAVGKEEKGFWMYGAALAGLMVVYVLLQSMNRFLEESTRADLENRLKSRLFSVVLSRDFEIVTAVHSGEWMNRLTSDTVIVADGMTQILPGAAGMAAKMTGAMIMILLLLPAFAWLFVPGGLLMLVLTVLLRTRMKKFHRQVQEADGRLRVCLSDRLTGLLILHAFGGEKQAKQTAAKRMTDHKKARMRRNCFSNLCNIGFGSVMNGAYVLGFLYCGHGILRGTVSYGTFVALLQLIGQVQMPLAGITGYLPRYYSMLASAERLMEAAALPDSGDCGFDMDDQAFKQEYIREFYRNRFTAVGLEDASFAYMTRGREGENDGFERIRREMREKTGSKVLEHAGLRIAKGEYVAFTGPSGSGKSTVLRLLLCLYSLDGGERYLEQKDGSRIALTGIYRRLFAYVPQGSQLMTGSIREIVAFGNTEKMRREDQLWESLSVACAAEFVRKLPEQLDTCLGERGLGLSEGQMQRIAIARAVCSESPVLMLDEATSALDEETEGKLLENLRSMTDRTVLIVTHRPAALSICDRQIRISGGNVYDSGGF